MKLTIAIVCVMTLSSVVSSAQGDTTKVDTSAARRAVVRRVSSSRPVRVPAQGVFRSLDSALRTPDSVVYLLLSGQKLNKLPPTFKTFKNLVAIDLGSCGLTQFPGEVLSCMKVTSLNLSDNQIKSVPPEIGGLTNLVRLTLKNTGITTLPASIRQCQKLTTLDVSNNPLSSLPIAELNTLPQLKSIAIGGYKAPEPASAPKKTTEEKPGDSKSATTPKTKGK